jgi:hypothetical protein
VGFGFLCDEFKNGSILLSLLFIGMPIWLQIYVRVTRCIKSDLPSINFQMVGPRGPAIPPSAHRGPTIRKFMKARIE